MSEQKLKKIMKHRRRPNPSLRWTEAQTLNLLQIIVDDVKKDPESFEKPTARSFYEKSVAMSPLLKGIPWLNLKNKMHYLKGTYITAINWKRNTDPLATGQETSVGDYLNRICPYFDMLEQIFGHRINTNMPVACDINEQSYDLINDVDSEEIFDTSVLSKIENNNSVQMPECPISTPGSSPQQNGLDFDSFKTSFNSSRQQKAKTSSSSTISLLLSMQEKKLELEVKRFELEKETTRKELQLKKLAMQQEFELKKLEIEKEERLQKYELDLKFQNNQL